MDVEEFLRLAASYGLTAQERRENFWAVSSDGYHYVPIGNPATLNMTPDEWQSMLSAIARRAPQNRREMSMEDFWNDINAAAKERRRRYGHIANYPGPLIEQLIQDDALTVEKRNELIVWKRAEQWQHAEQQQRDVSDE